MVGQAAMSHFLCGRTTYTELRVEWFYPHSDPPGGRPRILWVACIPWPFEDGDYLGIPPCAKCENWQACHYKTVLVVGGDLKPIRTLSPEAKARRRLGNLRRRIMKKAPLFKKPDYYDATEIAKQPTGPEIAARHNREKDEQLTAYLRR